MTKRLSAVVGEYNDKQTNQQKAEWQNVGVIGVGKNNKEYMLLDPTVNLAGVLLKQNILAVKRGEQPSDMVMTSIFEENNAAQGQQNNQQGGYQNNQQGQQQNNNQNNQSNNQGWPHQNNQQGQ